MVIILNTFHFSRHPLKLLKISMHCFRCSLESLMEELEDVFVVVRVGVVHGVLKNGGEASEVRVSDCQVGVKFPNKGVVELIQNIVFGFVQNEEFFQLLHLHSELAFKFIGHQCVLIAILVQQVDSFVLNVVFLSGLNCCENEVALRVCVFNDLIQPDPAFQNLYYDCLHAFGFSSCLRVVPYYKGSFHFGDVLLQILNKSFYFIAALKPLLLSEIQLVHHDLKDALLK